MKRDEQQVVSAPERLSPQEMAAETIRVMNDAGRQKTDREVIDDQAGQIARLKAALDRVSDERDVLQARNNTLRGRALSSVANAMGM
jgi:hypothetical protein